MTDEQWAHVQTGDPVNPDNPSPPGLWHSGRGWQKCIELVGDCVEKLKYNWFYMFLFRPSTFQSTHSFDPGFCENREEQIRNIVKRLFHLQNRGVHRFRILSRNDQSGDQMVTFDVPVKVIPIESNEKSTLFLDTDSFKIRYLLSKLKNFKTKKTDKIPYITKRNNAEAEKGVIEGVMNNHLQIPDYSYNESQDTSELWPLTNGNNLFTNSAEENFDNISVMNTPNYTIEYESIEPNDTLTKPICDSLISCAKYPEDPKKLVYGNLDNLGITYGDTDERIKYTSFRRSELLELLQAILRMNKQTPIILAISDKQRKRKNIFNIFNKAFKYSDEVFEENNEGREVLDKPDTQKYSLPMFNFGTRRQTAMDMAQKAHDDENISSLSESSATSKEDYDKNPGNPFTIYKNRYHQNWPWFFELEGNHMNVNPLAPQFKGKEPSGADLFFGRKWWYFNQDDYLPFR